MLKMYPDIILGLFAVSLRVFMARTFLKEFFQTRPEITTPLNSMMRVKEGVAMYKHGISPYDGDMYHGTPLMLFLGSYIEEYIPMLVDFIFPICDLITAIALQVAASAYLNRLQEKESSLLKKDLPNYEEQYKQLKITDNDIQRLPEFTKLVYLFNPMSIVSCVAQSTTVLQNVLLSTSLAFMMKGYRLPAIIAVALAAYNELYPIILIVPLIVWFSKDNNGCFDCKRGFTNGSMVLIAFGCLAALLMYMSWWISGNWAFLRGTYGFIIFAEDLTPNLGLFWYFFTEIFEQFREFFTWVFQMNTVVYVAPLAICLRDDGGVLFHQLLTIMAIFKSYPSVGDTALVISFLPALNHLTPYIRHRFIIIVAFIATLTLAPVMWYLWIHAGSANANFYFAVTLIYSTANIFLVTDLLYAHLRRQVHLVHGQKPRMKGEDALVILE